VGVLFNALWWFNSTAMKLVYFILSTIISFLLSWVIMIFRNYLLVIAIVIGVLLIIGLGILIILFIYNKKKRAEEAK
jgi:apolipoprotein N-acyltransferase